jgi:hypothetical protein
MKSKEETTLSNVDLVNECKLWVSRLSETGGRAWTLSVPVNFNKDPDMLIVEMGKRLLEATEQLKQYEEVRQYSIKVLELILNDPCFHSMHSVNLEGILNELKAFTHPTHKH